MVNVADELEKRIVSCWLDYTKVLHELTINDPELHALAIARLGH